MAAEAASSDSGAKADRSQRLRDWLSSARCRLSSPDYAEFVRALNALHGKFGADECQKTLGSLRSLAELLWRAEFPEGATTHAEWMAIFNDCLPQSSREEWSRHIRGTAPVLVPAAAPEEEPTAAPVEEPAARPAASSRVEEVFASPSKRRRCSATDDADCVAQRPLEKAVGSAKVPTPRCVICRYPPVNATVAAHCGHFACGECWERWIAFRFECPVCRKKVRPVNLIRLKGFGDE